ncbi:MAG: prepilin-type N-terminal cleavage/methylation domain-containing protein [Candidatus Omnitrophota bacterium]
MVAFRRAFTLVEAILTIAIIAILAMVVLPRFTKESFVDSLTLRSATSRLASDIRYTRQLAITDSSRHYILFDFAQKKYFIYRDGSPPVLIGETMDIDSKINLAGTARFDFEALGNCLSYSGGGLSLSIGALQNRISVEIVTGAVVIEKIS